MIEIANDCLVWSIDGKATSINSPWSTELNPLTTTRVMDGDWLFIGAFEANASHFIDFVQLRSLNTIARWTIDANGEFQSQDHFDAADLGPLGQRAFYQTPNSSSIIAEIASKYCNDLQVFSFIRYVMSDSEAAFAFINQYAPHKESKENRVRSESHHVHANVVFNHNYARNINKIESVLSGRFSSINYVLPNICPRSDRCFAFPAGSFSYHVLIYYMIDTISRLGEIDENSWYLFIHDDVYVNKHFSEDALPQFALFDDRASSLYYMDPLVHRWDSGSDWQWNPRIKDAIYNQKSPIVGNGFEGLDAFYTPKLLTNGVGDIFFVKGKYLKTFSDVLGNYISQNVFPEVAIPSSLKALGLMTDTVTGIFRGQYLWGQERDIVDRNFISDFDKTDALFFHPVKSRLL